MNCEVIETNARNIAATIRLVGKENYNYILMQFKSMERKKKGDMKFPFKIGL